MININFIPVELRKKTGPTGIFAIKIPIEIVLGVGGLFVFIAICVHVFLGWLMATEITKSQIAKSKWESLMPDKKNLDALGVEIKAIKKKMNTIEEITSKKSVGWSENINLISDHLPKSMWLRKLSLDRTALSLEGSIYSKTESEIKLVGQFATALKEHDVFMKNFVTLELNSILRNKRKLTDISDFSITAKLK